MPQHLEDLAAPPARAIGQSRDVHGYNNMQVIRMSTSLLVSLAHPCLAARRSSTRNGVEVKKARSHGARTR
eukprot:scaffold1213_cov256-Pinguiococcus_pyrenoidosus.AAC.7